MIYMRLPRHVVVLTEEETMDLLRRNPELWERGIKRGKAVIRSRARAKRAEGRRANA